MLGVSASERSEKVNKKSGHLSFFFFFFPLCSDKEERMKRTKESLLAQATQKHEKGVNSFSFLKFPNAQTLRVSITFLVFALVFFAFPVFLPDLGKELYRQKAIQSVSQFELTNEIFKGQFKSSTHSGDTKPNKGLRFLLFKLPQFHQTSFRCHVHGSIHSYFCSWWSGET